MKKIDALVLKSFLGPFFLSSAIALMVLDMQFLWKYVDDLVGKGLSMVVIAKLILFYSANIVPLAIPLGILLAGIMSFGNLGESYQITAIKSSGVGLWRFMRAAVVASLIVCFSSFIFCNYFLPKANLKFVTTLFSVYKKKPTLNIQEKTFYQDIPGYSIRIGEKADDGVGIRDVKIYDHSVNGESNVISAEDGEMRMTEDERFLILELRNGHQYQEIAATQAHQIPNEHIRTHFNNYKMVFDLSSFEFKNQDEDFFKDNYAVLSMGQLRESRDSVLRAIRSQNLPYYESLKETLSLFRDSTRILGKSKSTNTFDGTYLSSIPEDRQLEVVTRAKVRASNQARYASNIFSVKENLEIKERRYLLEMFRRYSLPFTCIVFVLVGVPLGAIIRKGGFGLPIIISVIIFTLYYVIHITGEKLGRRGELDPFIASWLANLVILPFGLFLTYKALQDSALLNLEVYRDYWKKFLGKLRRR